jgi:hypothetical protein
MSESRVLPDFPRQRMAPPGLFAASMEKRNPSLMGDLQFRSLACDLESPLAIGIGSARVRGGARNWIDRIGSSCGSV